MNRILILSFLLLLGCKSVKKDVSKSNEERTTQTEIQTNDESTVSSTRTNQEELNQIIASRSARNGILAIEFDSLTSLEISPTGSIRASGYAPKISSSYSITNRDTAISNSRRSSSITKDSTGTREKDSVTFQQEKKVLNTKEVSRTPSLIPYIGAAIAIILILAFIFKKKPPKLF